MQVRWPNVRYLIGIVAVSVGAGLLTLAYRTYSGKSEDICIALLVGLAILSFELFLIYVVVDQLLAARDRKRRQYAYTATARVLATCVVDVTRLLYLTTTNSDNPERERLAEFLTMTDSHLHDLRSYIEGFASILDDDSHSIARKLEAKLRWLYRSLSGREEVERVHLDNQSAVDYFTEMCALSGDLFDFVADLSLKKFANDWQETKRICEPELQKQFLDFGDLKGRRSFMKVRFACQSKLGSVSSVRGILGAEGPLIRCDVDGSLGMRYYLIDNLLFQSCRRGSPLSD
jgi:hypothetical protein